MKKSPCIAAAGFGDVHAMLKALVINKIVILMANTQLAKKEGLFLNVKLHNPLLANYRDILRKFKTSKQFSVHSNGA